MGSQDFVTGPYGHTFFFPDIMCSQDSITSRIVYGDTNSFSEIMGSQYSVTSRTLYGDTISFFEIMGSQYSVTGPYAHTFSYPVIMIS
ncbi:hypothetical protein Bpfe_002263 [Biomphalaria pfeifferi]|uniref:Uncharacterized protein n=1 Tax=Biomphalaria pfeifferi TaxID=112525 RepID=A0AAD8C8D7_BIOPF|nr:hypothetical protein Bpfe_002182 [Biomphalaria pfeifferi]KAK0068322.1 hypothetical protein Bpfe_002257 [Biomphalaria pfeifferi]KAK0068328.1 hypothetical protein Bpfe_002263 [Biomphalaria pfeifferi]